MTFAEIQDRIKDEMYKRGWSYNKMSIEAEIGSSTVYPVLNRNASTNIVTVIKLLDALDLKLEVVQK